MKIKVDDQDFKPFDVTITIESKDDIATMYHLFNITKDEYEKIRTSDLNVSGNAPCLSLF